jgi:hypothetical protein
VSFCKRIPAKHRCRANTTAQTGVAYTVATSLLDFSPSVTDNPSFDTVSIPSIVSPGKKPERARKGASSAVRDMNKAMLPTVNWTHA